MASRRKRTLAQRHAILLDIHTSRQLHDPSSTTRLTMANRDLTEEEVADLKEAFSMFDIDGNGKWKRESELESFGRGIQWSSSRGGAGPTWRGLASYV